MPFYNVHYPNGEVKRHKTKTDYSCLPSLGRVFYTACIQPRTYFYEIAEIGEEDIWVELITADKYFNYIRQLDGVSKYFASFVFDEKVSNKLYEYGELENGQE